MAVLDLIPRTSDRHRPAGATTATWRARGAVAGIAVTDPAQLGAARRLVERHLRDVDRAASRTRPDAEIHRLFRAGGRPVTVSPLLARLVAAALTTAERTAGDVDPTVAAALTAWDARGRLDGSSLPACARPGAGVRPAAGWEAVRLDGRRLQVPAGVTLDLSATASAVAVDLAAARVADRLGTGVLVRLGGDVATAGPAPAGGWRTGTHPEITLAAGTAAATAHAHPRGDHALPDDHAIPRHGPGVHRLDPRTGMPPADVWTSVTVIGFSALEASAAASAALVRGLPAREGLARSGMPARLVTVDGVVLPVGSWSRHESRTTLETA